MKKPLIQFGVAVLILVVLLGVYGYAYALVEKESVAAAALKMQLAKKNEDADKLMAAKNALEALGEDEQLAGQYFVSQDNIVLFLENLETAARALGAEVDVASVSSEGGDRERIQVALQVSGSFDAVMRAVGAIEYGPYDSQVKSLTIDTTPTDGGARTWTAAATILFGTQNTN